MNIETHAKLSLMNLDPTTRELISDMLLKIDSLQDQVDSLTEANLTSEDPGTIVVYRYIRPYSWDTEVDSQRGITLAFLLDYNTRTIEVGFSVCDGDNFKKETGREIAQERLRHYPMTMKLSNMSGKPLIEQFVSIIPADMDVKVYNWKKHGGSHIPEYVYDQLEATLKGLLRK